MINLEVFHFYISSLVTENHQRTDAYFPTIL